MLFNSYLFIFGFLPLTAVVFYIAGRQSRTLALRWLILASLVFYAWWRPVNVLLIAPSILINFALARYLQSLLRQERSLAARVVLIVGIIFNVLFLGYFKYANFFVGATNDAFGTRFALEQIILPLGISFITFQKIAFLIDVHSRRVESFTLQDYSLFVLFFPQLIAGPIVHYREMMPQFQSAPCVYDRDNLTVGATLFAFGLFKKAFLADSIAPMVTALFGHAGSGEPTTLFLAWMAAIGFTLQIYFDFSGYTDMALGAARLFGVRLPPNFNSPLRSTSIIEFWLRWHITLTRFLTAYLYNPLTLRLTRRRMAKGLPGFGGRQTSLGAFITLLAYPTLLTMIVSGFWHGAGYLFIIWGALHGLYLTINHAWRLLARRVWKDRQRYARTMAPIGFVLTLLSVVTAMVFFRATTLHGAMDIVRGMVGLNGVALPAEFLDKMGSLATHLQALGVGYTPAMDFRFGLLARWIAILSAMVLLLPNTLQMLAPHEPALGVKPTTHPLTSRFSWLTWRPSLGWALVIAAAAALGIERLSGPSEFLYWQF